MPKHQAEAMLPLLTTQFKPSTLHLRGQLFFPNLYSTSFLLRHKLAIYILYPYHGSNMIKKIKGNS